MFSNSTVVPVSQPQRVFDNDIVASKMQFQTVSNNLLFAPKNATTQIHSVQPIPRLSLSCWALVGSNLNNASITHLCINSAHGPPPVDKHVGNNERWPACLVTASTQLQR
eukprot:6181671-Amphidinium_carterae.1